MTNQDRIMMNDMMKEYKPKYTVGQTIQYKKKPHTIIKITTGFDRFGRIELQYKMEYNYTNYKKESVKKETFESCKITDNNSKLKEA